MIAHSGFGEPLIIISIIVVSLVIGYAFDRTKSLSLTVIPVALRLMPQAL